MQPVLDPKSGPDATALLAEGILGQFVFIHPHARLVIVRIGEAAGLDRAQSSLPALMTATVTPGTRHAAIRSANVRGLLSSSANAGQFTN